MDVQVKDNGNGTYACSYTPRKPVKHTAMISWGGVNIPDSPFRVSGQNAWLFMTHLQGGLMLAFLFVCGFSSDYR